MHLIMLLLLLLLLIVATAGQPTKKRALPVVKEAKLISCDVCRTAVREMFAMHNNWREERGKKITYNNILDITRGICLADTFYGRWMKYIDLDRSENGSRLILKKQEYIGKCRRECRTIENSCHKVFDDLDETDTAAAIWKKKYSEEKLEALICTKWTAACAHKLTREDMDYVKTQRRNEVFFEMDEDDAKVEQMMELVNSIENGAPPQVITDDDMTGGFSGDYDDDDYFNHGDDDESNYDDEL